jgi:phage terminase large subunit GpA-like protein
VTEPKIAVYSPRCPHCGRKMVLARIEPGGEAEQPADQYTYTCPQGHELTKRVERKE